MSPTEFGPQVQCAGYFQFARATEFHYELKLHHLILLEQGRLDAITAEGPISGKKNDFICFRPTPNMTYRVTAGTVFYEAAVQFSPPPRHLLTPELPDFGPLPILNPTGDAMDEFRSLFDTICVELSQQGAAHHFRMQGAIYRMLGLMAQRSSKIAKPATTARPLDAWDHIYLRVSSINGGSVIPAHLAREMGVSRGYFLQVFKQRFGTAPGLCRLHARLREAVRRLRETDESVKGIAYSLGFNGSKALTRALRKHLKHTASELREDLPTPEKETIAPNGLFPSNQHILPPGDTVDLLMRRLQVKRREL